MSATRQRILEVARGMFNERGLHRVGVRDIAGRTAALYELGQIVSSGWLLAEALRETPRRDEAAVLHYAKLGCALLEPYCTDKGRRQMRQILNGASDEGLAN